MKVRITGPESSGKTTLTRQLAWCLDGLFVAEQAREYLSLRGGQYAYHDLAALCRLQIDVEQRAMKSGASLICCDTGPEVISIWSEVKFGRVDDFVQSAVQEAQYDLTFLCQPDLPWEPDPLREAPDAATRWDLFALYHRILPGATIVSGNDRIGQAIRTLQENRRSS